MQIDKDIPPPNGRLGWLYAQEVLTAMNNHDSVFLAGTSVNSGSVAAFRKAAKMCKIPLTTRSENGGVRIWRMAPISSQYLLNCKADGA